MLWLANSKKRSYIIHSLNPEQRKRQIMDIFSIEPRYGSLIIYTGQKPTLGLQAFAEYYRQLYLAILTESIKIAIAWIYSTSPSNGYCFFV